jgi:predicted ATPase/DNA-binding CsgD family transcriptional regulator
MLQQHRLVTVVGPGGVGKTRLVTQWLDSSDVDVAGFVDLGPVPDGALLASTMLRGCEIAEESGVDPIERLAQCLGDADIVVVFDTCEHLRDDVASSVDALVRRCPRLRVIATSRVGLGVMGEAVLPLTGLGFDGAALFLDRARLVQPGLEADVELARAICESADGLPLAIELAAAHARAMSLPDIRSGMADRLGFLARRGPVEAERHLSIEASIEWSYTLLDAKTQRVLRALSVMPGPFTRHAAAALLGPTGLDALETLIDCSLVHFDSDTGRYTMLDTVREYALRELRLAGELDEASRQLVEWARALAAAAEPNLMRGDAMTVKRVGRDEDGVQAALACALEGNRMLEHADQIVVGLTFFWSLRGHYAQGALWAQRVATALEHPSAALMWSCAFLSAYSGDVTAGLQWAHRVTATVSDAEATFRGRTLIVVGMIQLFERPSAAIPVLAEAAEIAHRSADRWAEAEGLQMLAYAHLLRSEPGLALPHLDAALMALEALGHDQLRAWDACARADVAYLHGRLDSAVEEGRRGIALARAIGEPVSASGALRPVITALCQLGKVDEASAELQAAEEWLGSDALMNREILSGCAATIALWRDAATASAPARTAWTTATNNNMGGFAAEAGVRLAVALLGAGDPPAAQRAADATLHAAKLAEAQAAECDAALAWCVANRLTGLASATDALATAHIALRTASELGIVPSVADGLDVVAGLSIDGGRAMVAAQLHAASERLRRELNCAVSPLARQFRTNDQQSIAAQLDEAELTEARRQGEQLDAAQAVAFAARSRGPRRRPRYGWDSLTPTERQVADLVCDGLSNPEIGAALLIAEGTVRTHLRSTFAKLGFRSRAELAAEVARRKDDS